MRYEDASHTGAFQGSQPVANDDLDSLAAGSRSAATGNLITGEGTQSGSAGADIATGAHVTAIAGKSGEDTSFSGGKLSVSGEHGKLSVDAEGNYTYQANSGVENVRDRFTYTLADNNGATDTASLIVEIGKTPVVIKADATQIVPGPDGVVTLPPGVELSDIRVVGRDLVIDMPDGTQLIIVDGAIFVPQLVLNGVEVPSTNLAALLIGQEPQPAAGELPLSSGGNFDVPVPPLDPGVPLGDLIPPTELDFVVPEPEEVFDTVNRDPEIFVQPDGQPASVAAVDTVDEDGLPARNGNLPNEPAGSDEIADGNGSNNSDTDETTGGLIIYDSPDGVSSITINGVVVASVGQVINGTFGRLTITSIADGEIGYSYTLTDNTSGDATHDDFAVVLTDEDGDTASATLTINIIDDVPTARNDTDASVNGVATGNVMTDAAPGDVGDSDTNAADTVGADNATLTAVSGAGGSDSTFSGGLLNVNGAFGSLAIDAQGNYTYTVNPNVGGGGVDVFTYTLTDGDGDTTTATLTITNPDASPNLPDPAAVNLDDDVIPGANGNVPDGTGDDDPDVIGQNSVNGSLVGSGGDGDLDYAFTGTNTLPAGFTVNPVNSSTVQVLQGGTVVLTVTLNNETGAFTVVQNNPIDHPTGFDENNLSFGIGVQVVDVDGDAEPATITINVDDDTPEMNRADVSLPTLTVDETNLAANASGNYSVIFDGDFGADGPGTTSFAVSTVNGTDSGLVDVASGLQVLLYNIGGVVTGSTSVTLAGVTAGNTVFTVSVDSGTGVVTLDQVRAVSHPDASNPDDPVSPAATSIQLTATITDGDGDTDSLAANIGSSLVLEDDGPSISPGAAEPTLIVDESDLTLNHTLSFVDAFAAAFGADGPAGSGSMSFSLGFNAGATGLVDTATGLAVVLSVEGGMVVGRAGPGGAIVFTVGANASGDVTLDQLRAVRHADPNNPDESISLATDDLITITGTATDADGDTASITIGIGRNLVLEDDGPDISAVLTGNQIRIDETDGAVAAGGEVDPVGGDLGTVTVAAATLFTVSDVHVSADTPTTLSYALVLSGQGVESGLLLSTTNAPIFLYDIGGGIIAGSTSATLAGVNAGNTAFTVSINSGTGEVTLTQFLAVEHFNTSSDDEDSSGLTAGALSVQIIATDGDGDTDQASVDLGGVIRFEDDGPTIDVSVNGQVPEPVLLTQDAETDGVPTAQDSASSSANFGSVFNLAFTTGSDGAATPTLSYALGISAPGIDSGLDSGGASIFLYNIGGVVVGSTSATQGGVNAGNTVFDVTVDSSGVVTLTQYSQIDHPPAGDPTPTGPGFIDHVASLTDGMVTLTASSTITDNDGDTATDSATVNIGANLQFADDGPEVEAVLTGTLLKLDETDGVGVTGEVDPVGGNLGTITVAAATLVTISNPNVSADASTTSTYSLVLSADGVDSGLDVSSNNASIFLYNIGGQIVGSTSATLAGVLPANTAFTVSIDSGNGEVTMTQFLAVEHGTPGASHDEDSLAMALGALNLRVTATDFDGDTDFAQVDLGSVIRFEDDGPSAANDVDSIVGGNGPATGNVITGIDFGGGDANATDGSADNIGSDTPGTITFIASNNVPANTDGTYTAGNLVVAGQHGVLTINANGNYSYLRNDGSPGGVSDVFTYTLTDADGDTTTATLTIGIDDNFPNAGTVNAKSDDDAVAGAGGNAGTPAVGDDVDAENLSGNLPGSGGDGTLTFALLLTGAPLGFTYVSGGANVVLVQQGGNTVLTVTITNASTGAYTIVQNAPIAHPADNGGPDDNLENNVSFTLNYTVSDQDGDTAPGTINIDVDDDTPTVDVSLTAVGEPSLITQDSETDGVPTAQDTASASFAANFNVAASDGADGPASPVTSYALGVSVQGVDSGLDSSGASIFLYLIGGVVVGSTSATQIGVNGGNTVFNVAVDAGGTVTLTQFSQIDHPPAGDPTPTGPGFVDHVASLTDTLVTLTATATITDTDGDTATDSQVLNIGAQLRFQDDGPDVNAVLTGTLLKLDETDGVGVVGEVDPLGGNLGTITVAAATLVTITQPGVSADTPTTLGYSLVLSADGVNSGLMVSSNNAPIFLYNIGGVVTGSTSATLVGVNAGNTAFTVSVNGSGQVTMTQFLAVEHGTPGASHDEDSSAIAAGALSLRVTATDFDGDTDQASVDLGSVIRFEDDGPRFGTVDALLEILNDATPTNTGDLEIIVGSDSPVPSNDVISVANFTVMVNGLAIPGSDVTLTPGVENATTASYTFSFDYPTGPGTEATATGTLVFDKAAGTYTVSLTNGPIEGFTIDQTGGLPDGAFTGYIPGTSTVDGSQPEVSVAAIDADLFVQFTGMKEPSGGDNNHTTSAGAASAFTDGELFVNNGSWVSTSGSAAGVAGDTQQSDEILDFNLYATNPTGNLGQTPTESASAMFLKFDGIGASEDLVVVLKLWSDTNGNGTIDAVGDTFTTKAIMVQNADMFKGAGTGPGIYSGISLDQNDGLVIIEANDYNEVGENWQIVGAQIVTDPTNVTGTAINLNGAVGAAGGSDGADPGTALDTQSFATDVNDSPFKISSIGFVRPSTTDQEAVINMDVTVTDADGDTATQHLTVDIGDTQSAGAATMEALPSAKGSSSSLLASDSQDAQRSAANSNTLTIAAAAAAGVAEAQAAAAPGNDNAGLSNEAASVSGRHFSYAAPMDGNNDAGSALLGNDQQAAAGSAPVNTSSNHSAQAQSDHVLDNSAANADANSNEVPTANDQGPASISADASPAAPAVAMVSAEALKAAGLTGEAQQDGSVDQIVAEALGQGGAPTVDGLLEALAGGNGELAAIAHLASPEADAVSTWDMASNGGSAGNYEMLMKVGAETLHHDAVQPVVNG